MSVNFRFDLVPARTDGAGHISLNPAAYACPAGMNSLIAVYPAYRKKPTPTELRYATRRAANMSQPHILLFSEYVFAKNEFRPVAVFSLDI